jgi:hypothetical protein
LSFKDNCLNDGSTSVLSGSPRGAFSLIAMDGKYVVFAGAKSSHEKTTIFRDTLLSIITDVY